MPTFSISNGKSSLAFEPADGQFIPRIYQDVDGEMREVLAAPKCFTLLVGNAIIPARITGVSGTERLNFQAEFPGMPDWRLSGSVIPAGDLAPRFDWLVHLVFLGDDVAECRVQVRVSFSAGPLIDYPSDLELSRAKVEVYDPDLVVVATAHITTPIPVHQTAYFPDLQIQFNKGGDYVFLVSA